MGIPSRRWSWKPESLENYPDDVVGDVDIGMVLELAGVEVVVIINESELNATEVGVKNVAINEQIG